MPDEEEIRPNYYRTTIKAESKQGLVEVECFDLIDSLGFDFYLGNAMKYLFRAGKKDPDKRLEDLQKAHTYIGQAVRRARFGGMRRGINLGDGEVLYQTSSKEGIRLE